MDTPTIELPKSGILVDWQIQRAIELHLLSIEPFDPKNLEPATYDLRVGQTAIVSTSPRPHNLAEHPLLTIEPYAAALLHTVEIIKLSPQIVGHVGPKTSLLRRGIIASTGPQIDPGFEGALIINLINVTSRPFLIGYNEPFVTIEFEMLSAKPSRTYSGPYQGRTELTADEMNQLLAFSGPTLRDVHADFLEAAAGLRAASALEKEIPDLYDQQRATLAAIRELRASLQAVPPITVPVISLELELYELSKAIHAIVQSSDEGFVATFFDANINASGDTQTEAVENLKALMVELYEQLSARDPDELGPEPTRQLATLRSVIRAK